jgi:hypothetical protein
MFLQILSGKSRLDLFWGDVNNRNLYFFVNNGDSAESAFEYVTQDFLTGPTNGFNHPAFSDLDDDGDLDMVISAASELYNLRFYRNIGNSVDHNFAPEDSNMISMLDVGGFSIPAVGDLDNDSDQDLLLGYSNGKLWYFENRGSRFDPVFEFVSDAYMGVNSGANSFPALIDWDDDGDLDLLIGNLLGKIEYWRNDGSRSDFLPVKVDDQLAGIKVDQLAVPCPVDLNDDGLIDLLVGEWDNNGFANILLYENIGTPTQPQLELSTSRLLKREAREFTQPYSYDWDGDGRLDLIVGGRLAGLTLFLNTSGVGTFPDSTTLIKSADVIPGSDNGGHAAILLVDIDTDGDDDILVGNENGGLNFHRRLGSCCIGIRGNVDNDPSQTIDIGDLTLLIDYLFITFEPPLCLLEANVDGNPDEIIDIGDLAALIDYLFITFTLPAECS